jgi:hypothetical protein
VPLKPKFHAVPEPEHVTSRWEQLLSPCPATASSWAMYWLFAK